MFVYWPSFNGALQIGIDQERTIICTVLAILSSCIAAVGVSRLLFGKIEIEMLMHGSLAGGVAIGACANIISKPWASMIIGLTAGIISSFGVQRINPFFSRLTNLQDTCAALSVFGLPGILGAISSSIIHASIDGMGFDESFFTSKTSFSQQAKQQIYALLITLGISAFSGITGGFVACLSIWQPVNAMFKDDDHMVNAASKYPSEYLVGTDESIDEIKVTLLQIRNILLLRKSKINADSDYQNDLIVKDILFKHSADGVQLTKEECYSFLLDFIRQVKRSAELSTAAFDEIYGMIDRDRDGLVSKAELGNFVYLYSTDHSMK